MEYELANEYNSCIYVLHNYRYNDIDWLRIKNFCSKISYNSLNFSLLNNIYISAGRLAAQETINENYKHICPYESSKNIIYYIGIPPYYDTIRINNLIFKYVLNGDFCLCGNHNCTFKPPVPDINFIKLIFNL